MKEKNLALSITFPITGGTFIAKNSAYESDDTISLEQRYVLQTYKRPDFVLSHGDGVRVFDTNGKSYLDGLSGIAVNALGHHDAEVCAAIKQAADGLLHVSNLYHTQPQALLARDLVKKSFADRVFFCNSGTEAVEGALKFARKHGRNAGGESKTGLVAFTGSFHGRTMGALSVTSTEKYRTPYAPLIPGVRFADFNDTEAVDEVITEDVCGVIVEPVQGEGGVHLAEPGFLERLRAACDRTGALLIFDEVQCGLGRTGLLWAHQAYKVTPDLMTLAKPLAGGLPMGAVLMTQTVADNFSPGDHGSTFAAGPLVCTVARSVLQRVSQPDFLAQVRHKGQRLEKSLRTLAENSQLAGQVRGVGMIWGIECGIEVAPIINAGYQQGILVGSAGPNVLRILPPLTITESEIDELVEKLTAAFESVEQEGTQAS
jgi:acetylornithine/N-succinyldiaminopimelate aminotransferase